MKNKITPILGLCLAFLLVLAQPAAGLLGDDKAEPATATLNPQPAGNGNPVARDQTLVTYPDLGVCTRLHAMDPDRESLTYQIVTGPEKGTAELLADGMALYTPKVNKAAKDRFTYVAVDPNGNRSAPATITVEIRKRPDSDCLQYTDMARSTAHFSAIRLAEEGILQGEQIGTGCFFYPEQTVTRAEFVAMVASVCQLPLPTARISTGMSDDATIPAWAQSSVVAAVSEGIIKGGTASGGQAVFRGGDPITRAEAAAILDRALDLSKDGRAASWSDAAAVPAWAKQSLINTTAAGILSTDEAGAVNAGASVTREDAADMLYAAMCYLEDTAEQPGILEKLFG